MLILCYSKCSTCKNALKWLDSYTIKYDLRDIKENNPTYEEIKRYHEISKIDINKFFNTSGLVYKELDLKNKINDITLEEKYHLLSSNGMLVKRPMVIMEDTVLLGFNQEKWKTIFKIGDNHEL